MGETPGSSSGGKGWRQVARMWEIYKPPALSWREGTEGHAGPPSLLDKKLQPYERLTASPATGKPQQKDRVPSAQDPQLF